MLYIGSILTLFFLTLCVLAEGCDKAHVASAEELSKELSNPIADLDVLT